MCTETRLKENVTFFFSHSEFRYSRIYIISILNYNKQEMFRHHSSPPYSTKKNPNLEFALTN